MKDQLLIFFLVLLIKQPIDFIINDTRSGCIHQGQHRCDIGIILSLWPVEGHGVASPSESALIQRGVTPNENEHRLW